MMTNPFQSEARDDDTSVNVSLKSFQRQDSGGAALSLEL